MNGGKETPCVPNHYLKKYREDFDRPCPQIVLHPINEHARTIIVCALGEYTKALVPGLIPILENKTGNALQLIYRCIIALNSKEFIEALEKHRKSNG